MTSLRISAIFNILPSFSTLPVQHACCQQLGLVLQDIVLACV